MTKGYSPQISVILPVHNGEKFIAEAVNSVLSQTYRDFELIIINDGSSDRTDEILSTYSDDRIRIVNNSSSLRLSRSLNKGIELSQGKFIARMDADDISLPERFEKQLIFLDKHPEIGVVGCQAKKIDENGNIVGRFTHPTEPEIIKWDLFFETPLTHPTIMMRADIAKSTDGFSPDLIASVDYDYWSRLVKVTKLANLPEDLLLYRVHLENMTTKYRDEQRNIFFQLQEIVQADYIGKEKARELVKLLSLEICTSSQAVQAAELIYLLFRKYVKNDRLSFYMQNKIAHQAGFRIHRLVRPFNNSPKGLFWYLFSYQLDPYLIRQSLEHNFH
jgi:glycosyltransferase involved in cell wall biosynthesis